MHPDEQPQPVEQDEGHAPARAATSAATEPSAPDDRFRHLRRVRIEEDQHRKIEHARVRAGYADDVPLGAHDEQTFRLINQPKQLDELPGAELVVPELDRWKFWTKMNDWDVSTLSCSSGASSSAASRSALTARATRTWCGVSRSSTTARRSRSALKTSC